MMSQIACDGVLGEGETTTGFRVWGGTGMGWMDGWRLWAAAAVIKCGESSPLLFFGCFVAVIIVNLLCVRRITRGPSFSFQVIT